MTLEQAIPGLRNAPGGAIIAVADDFFNFSGPANAMMAEQLTLWRRRLVEDIRSLDPSWRDQAHLVPTTVEGMERDLNGLRLERAAAYLRVKGDPRLLQIEVLRFIQQQTDMAYETGLSLQRQGRLTARLHDREALGNYVDEQVRESVTFALGRLGIDAVGRGPVRVNRREAELPGGERAYRRPDVRIANLAIDMTLARKMPGSQQIRGFLNTAFAPDLVIIVRPRQIDGGGSYVIVRPGARR